VSLDPRLEEIGESPRSIFLPRHLHPDLDVVCLLRFFQTLQALGLLQICGGLRIFFDSGGQVGSKAAVVEVCWWLLRSSLEFVFFSGALV
jgi:hypothetical protein